LSREIDLWKLSKKAVIKKLKYVLIMETDFKRLNLQKKNFLKEILKLKNK